MRISNLRMIVFGVAMLAAPIVTILSALPAQAGPGHTHSHEHEEITQQGAIEKATAKIRQLVKKGKIPQSWASIDAVSAEKKKFKKGSEWVVKFNNDKIEDKSKQTLYVFFSLDGHYLAANYTGN